MLWSKIKRKLHEDQEQNLYLTNPGQRSNPDHEDQEKIPKIRVCLHNLSLLRYLHM
jgi:hypothetical protein